MPQRHKNYPGLIFGIKGRFGLRVGFSVEGIYHVVQLDEDLCLGVEVPRSKMRLEHGNNMPAEWKITFHERIGTAENIPVYRATIKES